MRPNGHGEDFRLHFAGCSSSCAQHQIADVGIEGVLKKVDGEFIEAMDIRIGGRLGENPQFGDVVVKKVPHWELNDTLLRIFTPLRDATTPTARRSATSRAAPSPSGGRRSSRRSKSRSRHERHRGAGRRRWSATTRAWSCSAPSRRRSRSWSTSSCGSRPTPASSRSTPACCSRRRSPPGGRSRSASASTSRSRTRPATGPARSTAAATRKVAALERALAGADAWITGIRREQSPTRANAQPVEFDDKRGIWKFNPLVEWTEKDLWRRIFERDLPYHPLHDQGYASIGCAPCTNPGSGREGRWAGLTKTECGLHV